MQTWLRVDGRNQVLVETFGGVADVDVSVVVTASDGRAALHCV